MGEGVNNVVTTSRGVGTIVFLSEMCCAASTA